MLWRAGAAWQQGGGEGPRMRVGVMERVGQAGMWCGVPGTSLQPGCGHQHAPLAATKAVSLTRCHVLGVLHDRRHLGRLCCEARIGAGLEVLQARQDSGKRGQGGMSQG
jgi:hypothetical protein